MGIMDDAPPLPQDLEACHTLLAEFASRLHSQDRLVVEQSQTLSELQDACERLARENVELQLTIQRLLARLYGRRSKRALDDPQQLQLNFGGDPAAAEALADAAEEAQRIL